MSKILNIHLPLIGFAREGPPNMTQTLFLQALPREHAFEQEVKGTCSCMATYLVDREYCTVALVSLLGCSSPMMELILRSWCGTTMHASCSTSMHVTLMCLERRHYGYFGHHSSTTSGWLPG